MTKSKPGLAAPSKAIDPSLDSLFSQSAGSVKTPPKSRYVDLLPSKPTTAAETDDDEQDDASEEDIEESESGSGDDGAGSNDFSEDDDDDEVGSSADEMEVDAASEDSSVDDEAEAARILEKAAARATSVEDGGRKRKRKQRDDDEDLEANYLERLATEDEPSGKRRKAALASRREESTNAEAGGQGAAKKEDGDDSGDDVPVHESLAADSTASELEKANRTVFLSNVSVEAVTSRKAKKTLLRHLSSVLDKDADPPQKVESIRFRSTAFESAGIPKRAAYIKKEVLEATTKSTNAYAVYSTTAAARLAVSRLNGTTVLDRHLRVDSVAHPGPVDHRRCVFVGNLGFVDDETVYTTKLDEEGKEVTGKRKRNKAPMDIEEGLWRVFTKEAGKVENVRVVRDPATRVGKGFAYVQFYDGNAVESAILLNGKKFPPMLPRELRVTRCKAPSKTARAVEARLARSASDAKGGKSGSRKRSRSDAAAGETGSYVPKPTPELQTLAGRASKLLGRFGAAKLTGQPPRGGGRKGAGNQKRQERKERFTNRGGVGTGAGAGESGKGEQSGGFKGPEQFVFEGRRASARDGKPKDLKFKTKNKKKDPRHKKKGASKAGK